MKVTCDREALLNACQLAGAAVTTQKLNPVLRNLKLIAEAERLTLLATDLELSIRIEVRSVDTEQAGEALIPSARFTSILREAGDAQVRLQADPAQCLVQTERAEFEMPADDPAHYPDVPEFTEESYHQLPAGYLRTLIRRTVFAAAKAETSRPAMAGVLWELDEGMTRLVASDGRRLAQAQAVATVHGTAPGRLLSAVVPTKAVDLLERTLNDPDESVRISLRPNEVLFRTERATVCSRLVEGRYPNWRDVFPKKPATRVPLLAGSFLAAVRQAAIMTDAEAKRVSFTFDAGKLTLQAQGQEVGRSKVELPLEYDGKPIAISFNPAYLIEMLRALEVDDVVTGELIDGNTVGVFRLGEEFGYLVMPFS